VKSAPTFKSKSAWASAQLMAGVKVKDVARLSETPEAKSAFDSETGMGYAFVYGIAKRLGIADSAADRKSGKAVQVTTEFVTVRCDDGSTVKVDRANGKVKTTRPKA